MKWFKFYGQDFITDPKMRMLTIEEKMCWVILMCLANSEDKNGLVSFVNEPEIMRQAGVIEGTDSWDRTRGFLEKFQEYNMIEIKVTSVTQGHVTDASRALYADVVLVNFQNRQDTNLDGSERQKRYRERLKISSESRYGSDVALRNDSDARIDKIREDKNIENKGGDLPDWLDKKTWEDWVQYRKEKKQKLTPISVKKQLKMLEENKGDHVGIINQSIQNGWTGLFPLRKSAQNVLKPANDKYKGL